MRNVRGDSLVGMSRKKWLGLLACCLLGGSGAAQTAKDAEQTLRDAVVKKQLYLHGFSADNLVRWRWDGSSLVEQPPRLHTLGVLTVRDVKFRGSKVEFARERQTVVRTTDSELALSAVKEEMRVEVDLSGGDVSGLLQKLQSLLFYPNLDAALADLPPEYRPLLPARVMDPTKTKQDRKACDCSSPSVATCGLSYADIGMPGMKPPSVAYSAEPEFSDEARQKKANGNVQVGLIVNAAGNPDYLWLARPAGMGLDANAMKAVSLYRFKPATCHNQPVPVPLFIDVSFRMN